MSYFTPLSFWEQDVYLSNIDVAIIGGGIVGMNAALRLKAVNSKLKIAIIERSSVGTAASSRNAGFACYGSPSEIIADLENMPEENVYNLVKRRVSGLALLKEIVGEQDLRYQETGGHEVFIDKNQLELHLDQLGLINRLICDIDPKLKFHHSESSQGIVNAAGIISNDWEGQIHPGYMTAALREKCTSEGIQILTNFEAMSIEKDRGFTIKGHSLSINASKVIICNNAFAKDLLAARTTAGRNQVLLTSPIQGLPIHGCYHYDRGYVYFRNVGDRVLIGGGRNIDQEVETTNLFGQTETIKSYLLDILERHILPDRNFEIEYQWSGILGFNTTKEPIVQEIEPGKFVAVGLGGMGVAIGTLVGQEVADLLLQS